MSRSAHPLRYIGLCRPRTLHSKAINFKLTHYPASRSRRSSPAWTNCGDTWVNPPVNAWLIGMELHAPERICETCGSVLKHIASAPQARRHTPLPDEIYRCPDG